MGLTRIKTGQSYVIFAQPAIGGDVTIRVDVQINWINEGYYVHIPKGGIYEVISVVAFNLTLKLIKSYREEGALIPADVIHPVPEEIAQNIISDEVVLDDKTWSSEKINIELSAKANLGSDITTGYGISGGSQGGIYTPLRLSQGVQDNLAMSHTHSNKPTLDAITDILIANWNDSFDKKTVSIAFTGDTNKTLTLTKEDGSILTASFLDNNDPQLPDDVINSLEFNLNNDGVLTAITSEGAVINVSLDGRYSLLGHKHLWTDITDRPTELSQFSNDLGNYGNWITKTQGDGYYAPLSHVGVGGNAHAIATTSVAGFMSSADKTKLNSLSNYTHPSKTWVDKANLTGATVISNLTINSLGHPTNWTTRTLTPADIGAEPAFAKNTAFNKNFGTSSGTVAQGNDSRFHTHSNKSVLDAITQVKVDEWDANINQTEGDARWALMTRTISAGTGLTGGGNLTANRTIALSATTQDDIAKGVTAHGWGDFRDFGLGRLLNNTVPTHKTNLYDYFNTGTNFNRFAGAAEYTDIPYTYGIVINMDYTSSEMAQLAIPVQSHRVDTHLSYRGIRRDNQRAWVKVWDEINLPNPATESWVNNQGFLKQNALNNYYTKTESLNQFVGLSGVQSIADTKTFTSSPVVPNPTLDAHAVNKKYVDDIEIGGRNLIKNTDSDWKTAIFSGSVLTISNDVFVDEFDEDFIAQIELKESTGAPVRFAIGWYTEGVNISSRYDETNELNPNETIKVILPFKRYTLAGQNINRFNVRLRGTNGVEKNIKYRFLKVEKGNKATDWTPAPEDQVSDWNETNPDSYSFLKNKPLDDIAKGVTAEGWGDFRDYGLGNGVLLRDVNDQETNSINYTGLASANNPFDYGAVFRMGSSSSYIQLYGEYVNSESLRFRRNRNGVFHTWREIWHDGNLPNPATQTWVNDQGFLKSNALSNYYTKTESLNQFVGLSGVQDIADTKTFTSSPVVPNPTLDSHAVNKGYVDESNEPKIARYRWTNPVKFAGIVNFPTEIFNSNLHTEITNNNERIFVEEGYYNVNVTLEFNQTGHSYVEIHMNAIRIASNVGGDYVGTTASTGVIYIGENDYISVLVSTSQNTINLIAEISFEKIE